MKRRSFLSAAAALPFVGPSIASLLIKQQATLPTAPVWDGDWDVSPGYSHTDWQVFKADAWNGHKASEYARSMSLLGESPRWTADREAVDILNKAFS